MTARLLQQVSNRVTGSGLSIRDLIDARAEQAADSVYLVDPLSGKETTFRDLQKKCIAISDTLSSRGINPGETVGYALGNNPVAATLVLGIMYAGNLATAINLVAGNDTIAYVVDHSEARLIITDDAGNEVLSSALKGDSQLPDLIEINDLCSEPYGVKNTKVPTHASNGLLMYTSGTTGRPKGVVLTHTNLIAGGVNAATGHKLRTSDRGMCVLPLYHINGFCVTVLGALVSGGSLVIPPKFSVSSFWQQIASFNCSWFSVVPTQISYLLHAKTDLPDLSCVRFGRSASAPLSPDVQEAFEKRYNIPIIETMGLTETAAQILSNPMPPGLRKIGSPGIAIGNEIKIAAPDQSELDRGKEGEVLVRGANVMRCYLKNEEASKQALTDEGWLRTGDLGWMDEDGYVYITGRLKELIIKGGENIAPREIDEALYSHPDVVEAAAFARRCERYGETVEAAVMLREGSTATEKQLLEICTDLIGTFKTPDHVHILSELPKGPSGKIQRIKLAEIFNPKPIHAAPE